MSTTELRAPSGGWRVDFLLGAWQMLPLLIGVIPFALILGAVTVDKGLSPLETMLMSGLVFAGSAQFVAAGLWHHPVPILVIVASTALINSRHLLMGAALESHMRGFGRRCGYLALFFLADEIWATALRRAAEKPLTPAYYFGLALPFYLSWLVWTMLGALVGGVIAHPERYGFDYAFAAVFLVILFGLWKHQRRLLPIAVSAGVALLVWNLVPGVWYIFAGGIAGTAVAALTAKVPA